MMKYRVLLVIMLFCAAVSAGILITSTVADLKTKPDMVEISRIKQNAEKLPDFSAFQFDSKYDFTVFLLDGQVLYSTKPIEEMTVLQRMDWAVLHFHALIDYERDGKPVGKIIIETGGIARHIKNIRIFAVLLPFAVLLLLLILYYYYMHIHLYRPFKKLKHFSADIAAGNLDLPLPMDRGNLFGEFTESFDILRDELRAARKKAFDEEKSKKELIASLTHDLKTPIAVVRAAGHLLEIGEQDAQKLENLNIIKAKTTEIDTLITDLFHSTLDELTELKVDLTAMEAAELERYIRNADQHMKVRQVRKLPECLILADPLRLNQVVGNILSNADKYAGTVIEVDAYQEGNFLMLSFKDFGKSLQKEEVFLISSKFYRGKNSAGKEGAGLGLFISSKLLEKMGGTIRFEQQEDGFIVVIGICLA